MLLLNLDFKYSHYDISYHYQMWEESVYLKALFETRAHSNIPKGFTR